jgi:hypothetical protein
MNITELPPARPLALDSLFGETREHYFKNPFTDVIYPVKSFSNSYFTRFKIYEFPAIEPEDSIGGFLEDHEAWIKLNALLHAP